jgi:hypothetical protein
MKLTELKPQWREGATPEKRYIEFLCPTCPHPETSPLHAECVIILPIEHTMSPGKPRWGWNGETDFEKLTLTPSIWHHCKTNPHFWVRDGEIVMA